ncbi:NADH-quinone oxidoreductase subunit L [Streptomyces carminius]|uniref:NADH-quinone oxidoreductase subunit L n=1 Tax=Streptomyces carminius TaxID=2665496 RepID=A0A2M8M1Y5_9ACTN|nr:NADH-quinone oxidoreductase subunit L [Streptomyces carminius]PJE98205.1 NADH-quinone oxidoreductase subunit L [Streptomyces carminius]
MTTTTLAVLVPLLPFLGALAGLLLGRRAPGYVRPLAVLPTVTSAVLAAVLAVRQGGEDALTAATRLTPTGNTALPVDLAFHLDGFAVLVAVLVGFVASGVQLYSTGYLRDDPRYPSYAALVSLFTSAMLLVVYSDDLIVLLVGWEVMGICSYFLVGHYWETAAARSASLKAFLVTKLGDVPFVIGILALASEAGTFRISTVVTRLTSPLASFELEHPTVIALLLLAGVAGKSAQFPLHGWLPDAMAGPTPVSALIHAATMVAAGVYFVARLLPVFTASTAALAVLAALAAVTMTGSALAALAQDDIKRVLAWSTVGQLGYMFGALAVGDRGAAVFHLISHGVFKALLFLAAGVVIHAAGTNSLAAMGRMSGLAGRVPDAYWTMTVALLALAAVPPFAGFFSKEAVLGAAEHAATGSAAGGHAVPAAVGWTVLFAGLLTALLTAAYAARLWLLAFHGRGDRAPDHGRQPAAVNTVLWALAGPTIVLGLLHGALPDWFDGGSLAPTLTTAVLATGLAAAGAVVMYAAWRHTRAGAAVPLGAVAAHPSAEPAALPPPGHHPSPGRSAPQFSTSEAEAIATHRAAYGDIAAADDPADPGRVLLGPLHRHAARGFHLDTVYAAVAVRPARAAARLVRFLDREVVDTYVSGAGGTARLLGAAVRRAQTGNVQTYLSVLLAASLVLAVAAALVAAGA